MSSSSAHVAKRPPSNKNTREFIIHERDNKSVSRCWQCTQIFFYFVILIGGIGNSIALGNITTIFNLGCVLHADLTIKGLDDIPIDLDDEGEEIYHIYDKSVSYQNVFVREWGNPNDCLFCTFSPAALATFAFLWGALFLQCGKGGRNSESGTQGWKIVIPALIFTCPFLIVSIVNLAMTFSGISGFCANIMENSANFNMNFTSCGEIFSLKFPWNESGSVSLYTNYIIMQTGAVFVFSGWLLSLILLFIRCCNHVDFVVLERKILSSKSEIDKSSDSGEEPRHRRSNPSSTFSDNSISEDENTVRYNFTDESEKADTIKVPLLSPTENIAVIKKEK